jgi:hypothetical protein
MFCDLDPNASCVMIEMINRTVLSLAIIELAVPLANVNASGLGSFSYINFEGGGVLRPSSLYSLLYSS